MPRYEERRVLNDQSRNAADKHREFWEQSEIDLLEENWDTAPLADIAAVLERTVEACRQKHYDLKHLRQITEKVKEEIAKVNTWSGGFTSLAEMGY